MLLQNFTVLLTTEWVISVPCAACCTVSVVPAPEGGPKEGMSLLAVGMLLEDTVADPVFGYESWGI